VLDGPLRGSGLTNVEQDASFYTAAVVTQIASTLPTISVVTVNRNMRDDLETTIGSIIGQTYPRVEFLVVDGASTDGSLELIQRNESRIARWISEPDGGIYDAMNKGVRLATGEWLIFMNSGDSFHDRNAIAEVFSESHADADLVYGDSICRYRAEQLDRFVRAESPEVLPLRMNCSHQSLFTRRNLLLERPFSLGLIASDYEFLVRMRVEHRRFKHIDRIVGVNTTGGISDVNRLRSLRERAAIATKHGLMTPGRAVSYFAMSLRAGIGFCLRRALPPGVTAWMMNGGTLR
jgi:glycosyltransferase involved in cell wall biosynthesis